MISKIGIKLADGTFFPILDENASSEHTLELTTVREHQESVQINLFKKTEDNEPEYIGSLIVEEIADGAAGEPTINLKIKLDEEKNLSAEAVDEGSGSKQSLKVSLKTLNADTFDVPDFDLSAMEETDEIGSDPNRDDVFIPEPETDYSAFTVMEPKEEKKKGFPLWAIILLIILCIGALVFAILLLTKKLPFADKNKIAQTDITSSVEKSETKTDMNATTSNPPKEDTAAKEAAAAEAKRKAEEAAAAEAKRKAEEAAAAEAKRKAEEAAAAEAKRKAEEAAAAEAKRKAEEAAAAEAKRKAEEAAAAEARRKAEEEAAAEAKRKAEAEAEAKKKNDKKTHTMNADGSVRYKIKWGDTLWDLSESFYQTPWKYKKIADYNKIKNPNLIISGTYINIPPK